MSSPYELYCINTRALDAWLSLSSDRYEDPQPATQPCHTVVPSDLPASRPNAHLRLAMQSRFPRLQLSSITLILSSHWTTPTSHYHHPAYSQAEAELAHACILGSSSLPITPSLTISTAIRVVLYMGAIAEFPLAHHPPPTAVHTPLLYRDDRLQPRTWTRLPRPANHFQPRCQRGIVLASFAAQASCDHAPHRRGLHR